MRFAPFLFCALLSAAASAQEVIQVSDHGRPAQFEIARDEIRPSRAGDAQVVLYEAGRPRSDATRRLLTRRALVVLEPGADVQALAAQSGAASYHPAPALANAWIFESSSATGALGIASKLGARKDVVHAEPLLARQQIKRVVPNDPFFTNQWHLLNTAQNGGTAGIDVRVTNVWNTYRGEGIRIGIVDDGLQHSHPDLTNADTVTDHDFAENDDDPSPDESNGDFHGTACAGVAAGLGSNALGIVGAAYRATPVGLRLIAYPTTDEDEANAMSYSNDIIQIKSSSWGPVDDGLSLQGPGLLTRAAFAQAAATGRGGKGTIFVWAGGNGGTFDDSNKDGYANSIYTIAVGAVHDRGTQASYSESGANLVICAPSDETNFQGITTTDLAGDFGYNTSAAINEYPNLDYTKTFGGTSSSAPLAAGVIALVLQANTNLGWRDVQEILMRSATQNGPAAGWTNNRAGFHFNHKYGAGMINATGAVARALTWTNLGPQISYTVTSNNINRAIPEVVTGGVVQTFNLASVGLRVEHVTLTADIDHSFRGDIDVTLFSPGGMSNKLAAVLPDGLPDYKAWTFMSVRNWGESSTGTWRVVIGDRFTGDTGTVRSLSLTVYGTAIGSPTPSFVVAGSAADDSAGNANGALDPGETIADRVFLQNVGATATNLKLALSTTNLQVTMLQAGATNALMPEGATVTNAPPFSYRLSKNIPCGTVIPFRLVYTNAGVATTSLILRTVGATVAYGMATTTYSSVDVPKPTALYSNTLSSLTIAQAGQPIIDDINVNVRIRHSYVSDLQIAILYPSGPELLLWNQAGFGGTDFGTGSSCGTATNTVFDDEADTHIASGAAPFEGNFHPESALAEYDGKPLNGTWRLRVSDFFENDDGTVVCWSVTAVYHYTSNSCLLFNTAPTASNVNVATTSSVSVLIQMAGGDFDGETITFMTNSSPQRGTLIGFNPTNGQALYTPTNIYSGTDTFIYVTSDGFTNSAPATVTIVIAGTPPCTDCDGDGMDDAWELQYFPELTNATAISDSDFDGVSDVNEFNAGSLPNDPTSLLKETTVTGGSNNTFLVTWQSHTGRFYIVARSTNLLEQFVGIATNIAATPPANVYTDSAAGPIQHYRIHGKNGAF